MSGVKGRSGRPPKEQERGIIETVTKKISSAELIASLADTVRDKRTPPAVRLKAVELLLAYLWGKPAQSLQLSGDVDAPLSVVIEYANSENQNNTPSIAPGPTQDKVGA